ncbi:MAG: restriction endonuclease subunit S [Prosthecobacter sp.]|nr:restriction endonuclease subunit S [Prosthecobacter sp.]
MKPIRLNASQKTKSSPAGELPVDWGCVRLDEVATIQTGLSKNSARAGETVNMPYLRVANVQDGHFVLDEMKTIEVPKRAVDRFRVVDGDLVLTEGGDADKLGRGALWRGQIKDCVHQNHLFVVRANASDLDSRFLALLTQSHGGRSYFQSCSKQSTNLASINSTQLRQFPTALPPLPEQRKIADLLTTWNDALEKLDALIEAKDRRKKVLTFRLLTGTKRLKGFAGKWKTVRLGEVLEPIARPTVKPSGNFLSSGIRSHGKGVFLKRDFVPANIALEELFELKAGDLVVNITFAWEGAAAIVPPEADGALVSHRFPTFAFREGKAAPSFFRHYILTHRFVFDCGLASPGGAGRNRVLGKSAFLDIKLSLPPFEEQQRIGTLLDAAAKELTLLHAQRAAVDQQKRGLMQRLLTGKLRVTT